MYLPVFTLSLTKKMKTLLAVGVISLGLVSCDSADKMRRQCSVVFSTSGDTAVSGKAYDYIQFTMGISGGDVKGFCMRYLGTY